MADFDDVDYEKLGNYLKAKGYLEPNEEKIDVIHLKRSDRNGLNWIIPESPEKLAVEEELIVNRNLSVMYHGVSCRIELLSIAA